MSNEQETYKGIDTIAYGIRWGQELILVLSVPALALGLIVGSFDFLSGGTVLQVYGVKLAWTLLQAIVLDACFVMYWVKVFSTKGWVRAGSLFLGVLLGFVAGGINFLQQTAELLHIPALQTLAHLGFPPEILLSFRALLSVVLLAVGAISVARKRPINGMSSVQQKEPVQIEHPEQVEPNTDKVRKLTPRRLKGVQLTTEELARKTVQENPNISLGELAKVLGKTRTTAKSWKSRILTEMQQESVQFTVENVVPSNGHAEKIGV